ncbi:PilZ domain-containing protein [Alishewanella jeotgali]|uniref:Type 4 fimbrial biogenesis protein PILZ n=1 Tax=Alishewanella jeotgali KCTC 22429 TaxID=1129374 RepID=H3ZJ36_9ALTE|nr:PilZ domain-containing protein [Alishewanella jeotgali]EHR39505.1 type 4 fimbrial biogenesis protein PILZ [Alishewanella jeotgali KCTC 22429]
MEELALGFTDTKELYRCYMSFFKNGGLFIRSARHYRLGQSLALSVTLPDALDPIPVTGKVAWVSPLGAQSSNPAGIGVAFIDDKHNLSNRIEKLLGAMLHSNEPTYTM